MKPQSDCGIHAQSPRLRFYSQSLAFRLLLILVLLTLACSAAAGAQTVASSGTIPGTPAPAEKKPAIPQGAMPAAGEPQQKLEAPPPQVSGAAPRPVESNVEPGQTNLEIRYDVQSVNVQGNTDRSFLHACTRAQILVASSGKPRTCDSSNTISEISFLNNAPVFGSYRFETSIVGRYTDNPRVDPERNSLQRGYLRLTGRSLEATLGDSLVNYSRLSFSQNIKGLHAWRQLGENGRITGTVGYFTDRWGSLYRPFTAFRDITLDCLLASTTGTPTPPGPPFLAAGGCIEQPPNSQNFVVSPANPFKPYSRFVAGLRLERKAGKGGWVAFNYSHGKDLLQSLPESASRLPAPEAANNHLFSFDTSLDARPLRLKVNGEIAVSWTAGGPAVPGTVCAAQSPVFKAAVLDSRCFSNFVAGSAYRAEVTQRIAKLNWRLDYSLFQPNFSSANARQIRDLQDLSVRGDYQFLRQFGLALSWRRSNDNLNGLRKFTNVVRAPEIRLTFRDLPFYRRLVLEVGYRERNLGTAGNPEVTCQTTPATIPPPKLPAHPGCLPPLTQIATEERFRSTRIPFFSLTLPVKDTQISFDYEHRHDMDAVVNQNSTDTDRFAFGYRGNYTWNNWDVIPSFRYELERLAKLSPKLSLPVSTPVFPSDFFGANDTSRSFNAQLQIEAPRYFRFEGIYREFNSVTLSTLNFTSTIPDGTPLGIPVPLPTFCESGTRKCYLNQGFKRPYWRAALTFKFENDENRLLTVYYERSNNFFNTGDPFAKDSKSFRETILGGTLLLRFRH